MSRSMATVAAACSLLLSIQAHAAPGDMTVADFMSRAERLESRGPLALFSSDLGRLRREVEGGFETYRSRIDADHAAGRTAHSCPPPEGGIQVNSEQILTHMRTYPEARRAQLNVREALFDMMRRRYPCSR